MMNFKGPKGHKFAESPVLQAVVKTDAGAFYITRLVKVTLGGCGG